MKIQDKNFNKDKIFFTSDTHFYHNNIIKYCDRPFSNVSEMNQKLIENWNSVVPKDGVVFHLGDVSLTAKEGNLHDTLSKLNGTKYLIVGNHEQNVLESDLIMKHFKEVVDVAEITIKDEEVTYGKQQIVMCHYPMIVWNGSHRGTWQLFGHVHGGLSNKGVIQHPVTAMDVGTDCHNYTPVSYQQVKEQITKQSLNKK